MNTPKLKKGEAKKLATLAANVEAEKNRKHPEPMSLFHKREKQGEIPPERLPKPEYGMGTVETAARAVADWENSDPFAFKRTMLHVRQGYLDPKELVKEYTQRTLARRAAKIKEADSAKINSQ